MRSTNATQDSEYAPPNRKTQITMADKMGPADEQALENLAQFADQQADFGEWHYGHVTAQRLRLLAQQLEQQGVTSEERERLHRTIADLSQQVEEAGRDGQEIELVFRFQSDGPGTIEIGDLNVMVSLLIETDEQEGAT